jgi:hypothetical protein
MPFHTAVQAARMVIGSTKHLAQPTRWLLHPMSNAWVAHQYQHLQALLQGHPTGMTLR